VWGPFIKKQKETHMKRHKTKWLLLLGIGVGLFHTNAWADTPADATITVTPVANVSLQISPTTYAYGVLSVNTSSVTMSPLTLTNDGEVSVTVDKRITAQSNPAGWTAGATTATDTYVLYASTSVARPAVGDFNNSDHRFGALNNITALRGQGGSSPTMAVSNSVDLWFRLDMPTLVTSQVAREITVRFTGTAQ